MPYTFSSGFLEKVKSMNDIVEVAAERFQLEPIGNIFRARCLHGSDSSPSLNIYPDNQSFYCYGCLAGTREKTGGSDILAFVQWADRCTWQEAVLKLAERAGLPPPIWEPTEDEIRYKTLYDERLAENRNYYDALPTAPDAKAYFASKGITADELKLWRLGSSAGKPVFAIMDERGRSVAFSIRNGSTPKYINSPTSPIFKKGEILYGLSITGSMIRRKRYAVVVEGYSDTIVLARYGVPVVGLMGTSFSDAQIALLRRYTDHVVLFLDGDTAGDESTAHHVERLSKAGFEVEALTASGLDPDDVALVQKDSTESWIQSHKTQGYAYLLSSFVLRKMDTLARAVSEIERQKQEMLAKIQDPGLRAALTTIADRAMLDIGRKEVESRGSGIPRPDSQDAGQQGTP